LLWRTPTLLAVVMVRVYQYAVSPLLHLFMGPGSGCRFHPSCSHYAVGALQRHGLLAGLWLALRRLLRCHPFNPGGLDPVPETFRWLPRSSRKPHVPFAMNSYREYRNHG
jgi:putative membrane protein insertion efficiency factor